MRKRELQLRSLLAALVMLYVGGTVSGQADNQAFSSSAEKEVEVQTASTTINGKPIEPGMLVPVVNPYKEVKQVIDLNSLSSAEKDAAQQPDVIKVEGVIPSDTKPTEQERGVPGNDTAENAWEIPHKKMPVVRSQNASECTNNSGCISYADYGGPADSGMNDGVWYKFDPKETGEYTITVTPDGGWDAEIGLFYGTDGTATYHTYYAHKDDGGSGVAEVLTITLYNDAATYWINIGNYYLSGDQEEGSFTLKIEGPQGNDRWENALVIESSSLPVSESQDATTATNNGSFILYANYPSPNPTTEQGMNDGVWYKFHPEVEANYVLKVDPEAAFDCEVGIFYRNGDTGPLKFRAQVDGVHAGAEETITFKMYPASTYYINVGNYSATIDNPEGPFVLSLNYASPDNDACSSPIEMPSVLPYSNTQYDGGGATTSNLIEYTTLVGGGGVDGGMNEGVWYKFTPTQQTTYTIAVKSYGWDAEVAAFYGTCGNPVYKTHIDAYTEDAIEEMVIDHTLDVYYNINVGHYSMNANGNEGKFDIKVSFTPENDMRADAITISPSALPYSHTADGTGATNRGGFVTYSDYGCPSNEGMNDGVWYNFTPTVSGSYSFMANPDAWDAEISLFKASGTSMTYIGHADGYSSGGSETLTKELTSGSTYYINIGYYGKETNDYEGPYVFGVVRNTTAVTGVTVSPTTANMLVSENLQLTASVSPSNASNTNVSWSSSNSSVATVNSSGLITAVSPGAAVITVTTSDGGFTATCSVTVSPNVIHVTGVIINPSSAGVLVGETKQLHAVISPSNSTNTNVSWSSNNTDVATVTTSGLVKGVAPGNAVITVTTADGNHTASCSIAVSASTVSVTGVTLSPTGTAVEQGSTCLLTANVQPSNATNTNVSWSSSNSSIATVDNNGLVTGVNPGSAIITVTTEEGNYTATCNVEVTAATIAVTGVILTPSSVTIDEGDMVQLTANVQPANASNTDVTWSSDNTSIAHVDNNGLVKAVDEGTAIITVTTADGGFTATSTIKVQYDAIDEHSISQMISIYPNPSDGNFTIDTKEGCYSLSIFDARGKLVVSTEVSGIFNISLEESGMYFLQFSKEDRSPIYQKIIVR